MTQYTKFTNLPIHTDPERTAITNTLIESIPFNKSVYAEDGSLVSLRNETITMLYTSQVLADSRDLFIYEEEDHGWSITSYDPSTRIRITERSNGDWDKYVLVNKDGREYFEVLEEHFCADQISQHKKFINCGTENNRELYFNPEDKNYIFNVTSFTIEKMRAIAKHTENVGLQEDYESAYFICTKEGMVNGIDQLILHLEQVKSKILNDKSV